MIDDPVMQILREAAARGRELRLARERAAQNEILPDGGANEARLPDPAIGVGVASQGSDGAVDNKHRA